MLFFAELAMVVGMIVLAIWVASGGKTLRWIFIVSAVFSAGLTLVAHNTNMLRWFGYNLPVERDPMAHVTGWETFGGLVHRVERLVSGDKVYLATNHRLASELAFYVAGQPKVLYANPGYKRQNQYDYWDWPKVLSNKLFIYVTGDAEPSPLVINAFASCVRLQKVSAVRGDMVLRSANVYACGGYKGIQRMKSTAY